MKNFSYLSWIISGVSQTDDISSLAYLFEETSVIVGSGSTPTNDTDNTSGVMEFVGKKTILALLAWLGLMTLY